MRKIAAVVILMIMVSCTGTIESSVSGKLRIKIAEIADSEGIEKMDIYVFNNLGALETTAAINLENNVKHAETELSVRTGIKDVYILANMESSLEGIVSVSDFISRRISMGEKGFDGGLLPMGGSVYGVNVLAEKKNSCTASLQRFPSRVHIGSIINDMECELSDIRFRLSNATGDCVFYDDSEPSVWFNKIYSQGSDITPPDDIVLDGILAGGGRRTIDECLFCFPNHTDSDSFSGIQFTPRKTRLVMSGSISGKTYYYPITFDSIERNTSYSVNIVIKNPGSTDPDTPVSTRELSVTIVPVPWSGPVIITETL